MTPLLRQTHCGVASSCRGSEPPPPACGLEMQALRDTDLAHPERRVRLLCRVPSSFRSIEPSLPLRACNGFEESGTRKFLPNSHARHISAIFRYVFLWGSIGFSNKPLIMEIRPTALRGDGHSRDSSFQNFYINPLSEPRLASRILYGIERCRSDSRKPGPIFDPCIERGSRQSVTIAVCVGHRVSNMGIGQIAVVLRPQLDERWHSERLPVADTGMTADQTIAARIASAARRITSGVAGASSSGTRPGAMLASAWVDDGEHRSREHQRRFVGCRTAVPVQLTHAGSNDAPEGSPPAVRRGTRSRRISTTLLTYINIVV